MQWDLAWSPDWLSGGRWQHCRRWGDHSWDGIRSSITIYCHRPHDVCSLEQLNKFLGIMLFMTLTLVRPGPLITGGRSGSSKQEFEETCNKNPFRVQFPPIANRPQMCEQKTCLLHWDLLLSGARGPAVTRTHARLVTAVRVQLQLQCPDYLLSLFLVLNETF